MKIGWIEFDQVPPPDRAGSGAVDARLTQTTRSNSQGEYLFPTLNLEKYAVKAVVSGFKAGTQLDLAISNQLSGGNTLRSPNPLLEVRLLSSIFAAEFGKSPIGLLSVITRSGTTQHHSLTFDYIHKDAFSTSNYWRNGLAPLKQSIRLFGAHNRSVVSPMFPGHTWTSLGSTIAAGGPSFAQTNIAINGYFNEGANRGVPNDNAQLALGTIETLTKTRVRRSINAGGAFVANKYAFNGGFQDNGILTATSEMILSVRVLSTLTCQYSNSRTDRSCSASVSYQSLSNIQERKPGPSDRHPHQS